MCIVRPGISAMFTGGGLSAGDGRPPALFSLPSFLVPPVEWQATVCTATDDADDALDAPDGECPGRPPVFKFVDTGAVALVAALLGDWGSALRGDFVSASSTSASSSQALEIELSLDDSDAWARFLFSALTANCLMRLLGSSTLTGAAGAGAVTMTGRLSTGATAVPGRFGWPVFFRAASRKTSTLSLEWTLVPPVVHLAATARADSLAGELCMTNI